MQMQLQRAKDARKEELRLTKDITSAHNQARKPVFQV